MGIFSTNIWSPDIRLKRTALIACFVALCTASQAPAGNFRVTPIRLELDRGAKSGAITVINEGTETMNFQVSVSEWTQDDKGKDVYADTADMIFFPKILSVEPRGQRVIRVGTKGPSPVKEKTYRLFIEEIPAPATGQAKQSTLSIAIRFAPPIFRVPVSPQRSGTIERADVSRGVITAVVKNTGTAHFLISSITARGIAADGSEVFSLDVKGWYLLQGASRTYEITVPLEKCIRASRIDLTVQSDTVTLNRTVDVRAEMCSQ